jgi:hypothetical protein
MNTFTGALRSAQPLMGLYPPWWRSCGEVFCKPVSAGEVRTFRIRRGSLSPAVSCFASKGRAQAGVSFKGASYLARPELAPAFCGVAGIKRTSAAVPAPSQENCKERRFAEKCHRYKSARDLSNNSGLDAPSRAVWILKFQKLFAWSRRPRPHAVESDTPQGSRGGAENNPIRSVRMSSTPEARLVAPCIRALLPLIAIRVLATESTRARVIRREGVNAISAFNYHCMSGGQV